MSQTAQCGQPSGAAVFEAYQWFRVEFAEHLGRAGDRAGQTGVQGYDLGDRRVGERGVTGEVGKAGGGKQTRNELFDEC